ncbi:MFS transporter [Paenibacillus sp. NPDC056722]|uniref:MFS transporter n=1 Tax=Paenibacillus sp. NPDC056722 TaxID=3345924 RepID=UPI00367C93EB
MQTMQMKAALPGKSRLNWTMAGLFVSIFLTQLDQTIVSTALPTIVKELHGLPLMSWVFTIYMLTSTMMMPIAGKLSDLYGRKRFYMLGLVVFILGSALCGIAQSMPQLIFYRAVQGLGAGFLIPVTYTLVFTNMPKERAGIYQTLYMGVFAVSSVSGPALGAWITEHLDWRYNFYMNIPLGILVFVAMGRLLPVTPKSDVKPSVDKSGALLLAVSTFSILLGLKLGGEGEGWMSWQVAGLLGLGLICLVAFLRVEVVSPEPILPLVMFRNRAIGGTLAATFLQGAIMYGSLIYIPLFVQGSLGGDASDTGGVLTPFMFSVMVGAAVSSSLIKWWSWRVCIFVAMLISAGGLLGMTAASLNIGAWHIRFLMILIGVGVGIMMTVGQMAVTFSADERIKGVATSSVGFFRSVGGVFGTAVMAAVINMRLVRELPAGAAGEGSADQQIQRLLEGASANGQSAAATKEALAAAVHAGFWFLAAAATLGLVAAWWTGRSRFTDTTAEESRVDIASVG